MLSTSAVPSPGGSGRPPSTWVSKILGRVDLAVLRLIGYGYRNKQIADQLAIAEMTDNFHVKHVVDKLGANDRTHAVSIAVRRGLLQI